LVEVDEIENERFIFTQNVYPIYESDMLSNFGGAQATVFSALTRAAFILKLMKNS